MPEVVLITALGLRVIAQLLARSRLEELEILGIDGE
jgi:hypothetical protein